MSKSIKKIRFDDEGHSIEQNNTGNSQLGGALSPAILSPAVSNFDQENNNIVILSSNNFKETISADDNDYIQKMKPLQPKIKQNKVFSFIDSNHVSPAIESSQKKIHQLPIS